jgi:GIGANTEA protein
MWIALIYGWTISCLKAQITAYVEYFGQFTADSDQFPEDIAQVLNFLESISCSLVVTSLSNLLTFLYSLITCMQLIQSCYPSKERRLVDEVLGNANFW